MWTDAAAATLCVCSSAPILYRQKDRQPHPQMKGQARCAWCSHGPAHTSNKHPSNSWCPNWCLSPFTRQMALRQMSHQNAAISLHEHTFVPYHASSAPTGSLKPRPVRTRYSPKVTLPWSSGAGVVLHNRSTTGFWETQHTQECAPWKRQLKQGPHKAI
jgi:hypothetical protein